MKKLLLIYVLFMLYCENAYPQNMRDAQQAVEAEQYEKAKKILEKLIKENPIDGEYYFQLGKLYIILGEDILAGDYFNKGIELKENGRLNYIGLGHLCLNEGKLDEAMVNFSMALQGIRKKDTKELLYIAGAYAQAYYPDYEKAAEYARKVIFINRELAQAYLVLGDAEYNMSKISDAYSAYRNAFDLDNGLLRAKLHMAVITKNARSFPEAVQALNEILTLNPNYGPAYRELAETYYLWSLLEKDKYSEYVSKALAYYEKYMTLTDYSLNSRMRHADFLVLAKDYGALEKEAMEMQKIDNVNPRIFRYLGYSAYENGNYMEAIEALSAFIAKVESKRVVALDFMYLAKAEARLTISEALSTPVDTLRFDNMLRYLQQAIDKDALPDSEFSELGIKLYKAKEYAFASQLFGILISNAKCSLLDNLYFANSVFYTAAAKTEEERLCYQPQLYKADSVYALVTTSSPTTQDAHFNRARLNRFITGAEAEGNMVSYFENYIKVVTDKGPEELAKELVRSKLSEAYTSIGIYYVEKDKQKAVANFEKAIEYDPANEHAIQSLKFLEKSSDIRVSK